MTKKLRLLHSRGWENFLTGDYIGSVMDKGASKAAWERAEWIDSTICEHIPKWKAWLVFNFPWSRVAWLFMPKIEIEIAQLLASFGTRTAIRIGGKLVGSRKFKITDDNWGARSMRRQRAARL